MYSHYIVALITTVLVLLLTNTLFRKLNIVDEPDGSRKLHKGNISLGGGLVLFTSMSILIYLIYPEYSFGIYGDHHELRNVWIISLLVLLMGLWDDIKPMRPVTRIIIQVLASWAVIVTTDLYLKDLGNLFDLGVIYLGNFGIPITIFMVVGVCNAFNMLDGMDGLVTLVLLIPSSFIAYISYMHGIEGLVFLGPACLSVFLLFNLGLFGKKFKMFLGDSGAMWLGFLTAWFLICLTQNETKYYFPPMSAVWFILIPIIDAISTFITRAWNKRSMFDGDRSHLHHVLTDSGLKKWKVLVFFIIISASASSIAAYFILFSIPEYYQFYGFLTVWFFYHILLKGPSNAINKSRD